MSAPRYGGQFGDWAAQNFPSSRLFASSFAATPIEIDGERSVHASGFFYRRAERTYLITNWHVVTGIDPLTGQSLSNRFNPQKLAYYASVWHPSQPIGHFALVRQRHEVQLQNDHIPTWRQHENFRQNRADIVAIEVAADHCLGRQQEPTGFNMAMTGTSELFTTVGDDVFAVGYPFNTYDDLMSAIWKRGSIATEPLVVIDGRPMYLIDIAGTKGMSGSAVVRRAVGPLFDPSTQTINAMNVRSDRLIGVYSGRLQSSELERVSLGIVWYAFLIDEIIDSGEVGSLTFV